MGGLRTKIFAVPGELSTFNTYDLEDPVERCHGVASIRAFIPSMDAEMAREVAQELEGLDLNRETPERIIAMEKRWGSASFGLVGWVGDRLLRGTSGNRGGEFSTRHSDIVRRTRRVILMLAAHSIEARTGQRVTDPSALVPSVLKAVPLEPGKSTPMTEIPAAP